MSLITKGLGRAGGGSGGIGQIVADLEGTVMDDLLIEGTVEEEEFVGVISNDGDIIGEVVTENVPGVIQSEDIEGNVND